MLSSARNYAAQHFRMRAGSIRNYRTTRELIVTQKPGSQDCTRAAIATIINHLTKQPIATIGGINEDLLARCEIFRSKGIDGLQPNLEQKAAFELFTARGLLTKKLDLNTSVLTNRTELEKLMYPLESGMILASTQPPFNSPLISHSVVITDIFWSDEYNELMVGIFDPYPVPGRDINGRRTMSVHDIVNQKLTAQIYVCKE